MMNIKTTLADAASKLGSDEAALDARLLLQHVLNVNHAWLIAHADETLTPNQLSTFEARLQRRLNGEPIAHILGSREFFGLPLKVTSDTLIPRPDTETLVEAALSKISLGEINPHTSFPREREPIENGKIDSRFRGNDEISGISETTQALRILDLGTGTGAIALAIAKNCPLAHVTAVDFSESALAIAKENAENLAIHNVAFLHSHWFSALNNKRFDVIVSNPPYIAENDPHLSQGDLRFEPKSALTSGVDGLDDIRHIIEQAPQHLNPNGWLLLEHGYDQAKAVAELLVQAHFKEIGHGLDLAGIQRVTFGKL
jgi:release factor glutamine methyltransferase